MPFGAFNSDHLCAGSCAATVWRLSDLYSPSGIIYIDVYESRNVVLEDVSRRRGLSPSFRAALTKNAVLVNVWRVLIRNLQEWSIIAEVERETEKRLIIFDKKCAEVSWIPICIWHFESVHTIIKVSETTFEFEVTMLNVIILESWIFIVLIWYNMENINKEKSA